MYDRTVEGRILTFRFNPEVLKENLLFEDIETGSVWSQLSQTAEKGPLQGTRLKTLPALQTTWEHWKQSHPETTVLSPRLLGLAERSYKYPPSWALGENFVGGMRAGELVLAIELGTRQRAYPFYELKKAGGKVEEEIDGKLVQIVYHERSNSAVARDQRGKPLVAFTVYWGHWLNFYPQTEVYTARKRTLRGTVRTISHEQKIFQMTGEESSGSWTFSAGPETKWEGNRSEPDRKHVSFNDLRPGLRLEIKFIEGVRQAREVKILK